MAVLYIGNGTAKKVNNLYIGVGGQAKKVTKGYIGVGGQAKLFYSSAIKRKVGYINRYINNIYNIRYNTAEGYSYIINTSNSDGYIWSSSYNNGYINTECDYIYLYENCYSFLKTDSSSFSPDVGFSIENLGFNYVKNLAFFSGWGDYSNKRRITGNISNLNFLKVSNAYYAFNNTSIWGTPPTMYYVFNMAYTYQNCGYITGTPMHGDYVTNLYATYGNCTNLNGHPTYAPNAIDMTSTYYNCSNLTGEIAPVSTKTERIEHCYENCFNCNYAPNFRFYGVYANYAFGNVRPYGNFYFYNAGIMMNAIFFNQTKETAGSSFNRLNIYINKNVSANGGTINDAVNWFRYNSTSIGRQPITWTAIDNGVRNLLFNIYVYNNL